MLNYHANRLDQLKQMTRDVSPGSMEVDFLDVEVLNPRARDQDEGTTIDEGCGLFSCGIQGAPDEQPIAAFVTLRADQSFANQSLMFAQDAEEAHDGSIIFPGVFSNEEECSLSLEQIDTLVKTFVKDNFPDLFGDSIICKIAPIKHQTITDAQISDMQVMGYYVRINLCYNGIPVLWDAMRLRIQGNKIAYVSIRRHKPIESGPRGEKEQVYNADTALGMVSDRFKNDLSITGEYEIVDCKLYYADPNQLKFGQMPGLHEARRFIPVWRYAVKHIDASARRRTSYVFVEALVPKYLESMK